MAFYCFNSFVLTGFLSSNTVFAAGSEAAYAVIATAMSPCGSDFTDSFLFSSVFSSGIVSDCHL